MAHAAEQLDLPDGLDPRLVAWAQAAQTGDPLLFATGVLNFLLPGTPNPNHEPQLDSWQVKALKKFRKAWRNRFEKKGRISIRSGHGIGKTCFLAICVLFVLLCAGPDTKIPCVANSQDQLRDGLWSELSKWRNHLPDQLRDEIDWQREKVCIKSAPEEAFAVRRTASKHRPEALQGMHATNVLAILEEASGIPEETIEAGAGTLSTPGAIAIAVGNPTRTNGFFFKTHKDPRMSGVWDTMVVSSEEVPRARGHIEDIIALYGKNSNAYRVRVLGEFPNKNDDTVIPLSLVEAARGRDVEVTHVWPVWGVDVARFGDDRSVLAKRQGNHLLEAPRVWQNMDGPDVAGRIVEEYRRTPNDMKPKAICVDVIGYGASCLDTLKRNPILIADDVAVIGVNVAETESVDGANSRLRDELWWNGRQWFEGKDVVFPQGPHLSDEDVKRIEQLISELTTPTYSFSDSGKRVVLSKRLMKKDLGYSPDMADAFLLSLAAGPYLRETETTRRWVQESYWEANSDPWSA